MQVVNLWKGNKRHTKRLLGSSKNTYVIKLQTGTLLKGSNPTQLTSNMTYIFCVKSKGPRLARF